MRKMKRVLSDKLNPPNGDYWVMIRRFGLRKDQTKPNHTKLVSLNKGLRLTANHKINPTTRMMEKVQPNYFAVPIGGY